MKGLILAIVVVACCGMTSAQTPTTAELSNRVDALAKKMLSRPFAGISIAVARDGKVIFARGYGMANLEHSVAVTPETVFHIASISKNILAAVLLQLVDEGKLSLDDDVTKYVPEAPTHGNKVSVRQLINHTSGMHSFTSLPEAAANERLDLNHDQVLALIKNKPFDFEPGTSWSYDNTAFYIAGMVAERVTKQEYGAYVREHVFKPLGMGSSQMCDARMVVPHLASGYEISDGTFVNASFLTWKLPSAAGAICATATDLVKWQAALDSGRVLSQSSLAMMRTPTRLADGTNIDYGLGTRLGLVDGHRVLGHTGGGGGFLNVLESFPDDHLTIVVLTNTYDGSPPPVPMASAVARSVLGLPEKIPISDLPVPKTELDALTGRYDSNDGVVDLFERDGKVGFRLQPSRQEGFLFRQAPNVYAVNENIQIHFIVKDGRARWSMVYVGGLFFDAKYRVR